MSDTKPLLSGHRPYTHPQPVKTFNAGIVDGGGYGELSGFARTLLDTQKNATDFGPASSVPAERRKRVIIVGAGISGVQQATVLLRDGHVKHDGIQVFDALDGYGGVWAKNKYPGCACDVPAMIYTTSYHVCKKWTHFYATQPQIESYYTEFAHAYQLDRCTRFRSFVKACTWDEKLYVWHVAVEDKDTGELQHWIADVVCQCVGSLDRPKWGTTPGRKSFKGVSWHTAHWRHDYDLTGKKVAIIGCGPSAAQIIPEIIDRVGHLTVYMRTPPVCVPRMDYEFSRPFRWAVTWIPLFAYMIRQYMNVKHMIFGKRLATIDSPANNRMTKLGVDFMESQIKDPELREKLRPFSKYFCKRPLRLDHFYSSLAKPNCQVTRDDLVRFTEAGVISADKTGTETERQFDVIIFGTGFNVAQFLEHEKITGICGVDLQEQWKEHPEALYGLATSNFPNMFMCFGPNSATVWSSQPDNWKLQACFAGKVVREVVRRLKKGRKLAMYPRRDIERVYNDDVQKGQNGIFVWAQPDCITYYKNDAGWNTFTMPWSYVHFWWMVRKIRWEEWVTTEIDIKPMAANGTS